MRYNNNEIYFDVVEVLKAVAGPCVEPILLTTVGPESARQDGDAVLRGAWED